MTTRTAQRRNTGRNTWLVGLSLVAAVTASGCQETEGTIVGPRGGVIMSDDGAFMMEIPAGALDSDADITIEEVECRAEDAIQACYEVGPVGLPMLKPARVTYEVDDDLLRAFPDELAVFVERERDWSELGDRDVLPSEGEVSASALYLSSYALVAAPGDAPVNAAAH